MAFGNPCYHQFNGTNCPYKYHSCIDDVNANSPGSCLKLPGTLYSDASAAWVLISAIIVFFMKAGFMLLESAFAKTVADRRNVIIIKHIDAFASAFGFFIFGCDFIANYTWTEYKPENEFFSVRQPLLWFFKFTFASNAATLLGGCLIDFKYKLRLPAAFISAFVISGITHPVVAKFIWSDYKYSLSPFRYCSKPWINNTYSSTYPVDCKNGIDRIFVLDFAGGGAVHLLGGVAGLIVCLFAKLEMFRVEKKKGKTSHEAVIQDEGHVAAGPKTRFLDWMYSDNTEENIEHAALGVLILWFAWFAFNCGSTENINGGLYGYWHSVPARIAVNMIICCASGGTTAVLFASWAQMRIRARSLSANEIANGVLSCLVAVTASCPFLEYWQSFVLGIVAIFVYHIGVFLEFKLGIPDTARVVPVHGLCGLLSLLAASLAAVSDSNKCLLHATYEGIAYCKLILPDIDFGELLGAQLLGALLIIAMGSIPMIVVYGVLFCIPMWLVTPVIIVFTCTCKSEDKPQFHGHCLFTHPDEDNDVYMTKMFDECSDTSVRIENSERRQLLSINDQKSYSTFDSHSQVISDIEPLEEEDVRRRRSGSRTNYAARTSNLSSRRNPPGSNSNLDFIHRTPEGTGSVSTKGSTNTEGLSVDKADL